MIKNGEKWGQNGENWVKNGENWVKMSQNWVSGEKLVRMGGNGSKNCEFGSK